MHAAASNSPEDDLASLRGAFARLLALAVGDLIPGTATGSAVAHEDGFYAEFAAPRALHPSDLPALEARMREQIAAGDPRWQGLPADAFCLRTLGGAYAGGDARNVMLTRIYGWAFASKQALAAHAEAYEHAALRDHKKLGRELELFTFDDEIGAGLPLWLPRGAAIRDELEKLMRELEFDAGFERVATPQLARQELYYRTGHLPYYADGMFPFMKHASDPEGAVFALRPMNCPHHHKIFAARKRSYRELPFRISEYGHVYRYEDSGAVSGLLRTRCMCMNDAHIYCSEDQVVSELKAVLAMHEDVYRVLGLESYRVRLSTRGPLESGHDKFVDDPAGWAHAEGILRQVLLDSSWSFFEGPGEAAFYGPKIDFQFRMVTGREETASTLQLDFAMAERLDLAYVGPDGERHRPFILHRAPLGTHERFVALLIERFGGAFPTWLAPVQVRVLPVHDDQGAYAREVVKALRARRVRAELDPADSSLGKRVRDAALCKVPNVLVVGERERAERTVSLRRHGQAKARSLPLEQLVQEVTHAIEARALDA
jgi:threonyl-tRNA synthetase